MEDDDGTAALVLRLQLEDLASILTPADGEGNSDNEAAIDQAYALQLYQQELSAQRTILNDRRIASDIQAGRRPRIATTETGLARPADHSLSQEVRQRVNPWRAVVRAALPAPHLRPVQPAAGPATEPGTETAIDLAPEPTAEPAAEPIPESIPEPTPEPVAKPAAEPNPELNPESATALAVESVAGTTSESVPEPISEPTPEPATDMADDPVVEPASEAPAELATEPPPQLTSGDDEVDTVSIESSNKNRPGLLADLNSVQATHRIHPPPSQLQLGALKHHVFHRRRGHADNDRRALLRSRPRRATHPPPLRSLPLRLPTLRHRNAAGLPPPLLPRLPRRALPPLAHRRDALPAALLPPAHPLRRRARPPHGRHGARLRAPAARAGDGGQDVLPRPDVLDVDSAGGDHGWRQGGHVSGLRGADVRDLQGGGA